MASLLLTIFEFFGFILMEIYRFDHVVRCSWSISYFCYSWSIHNVMKWNSSMNSEMKVWAHHLYLLDSSQHILRNDKLCFWILLVGFQNFIWHYTADRWCTKELEIQFKFNVVCHWNKEKQNKTKNKRVLVVLSLRPLHILLFIICNNYSFKEPFSVYLHCTCCDILCCFILKTATRTSILLPTYDCMITLWTYVFQDAHSDRKCRMSGDKKKQIASSIKMV